MIKVFLLAVILVALAALLLGIKIFFSKLLFQKEGKFPITSVGHNPEMRKIGITCVKHEEIKCHTKAKKGIENNGKGCSCG